MAVPFDRGVTMVDETVFDTYRFDVQQAVQYGFVCSDGTYVLKKPLSETGFFAVFSVTEKRMEIAVYEDDGEPYLPFNVKGMEGGFVGSIRAQVELLREDIIKNCFVLVDIKALLLEYLFEKYGTVPAAPWGEYEEYYTMNTAKSGKWYGLFMRIPYKTLGLDAEGRINVLNLKVKPQDVPTLIDNRHFFPAYHMNKKHWITILLDREVDIATVRRLLDDSYRLAEK